MDGVVQVSVFPHGEGDGGGRKGQKVRPEVAKGLDRDVMGPGGMGRIIQEAPRPTLEIGSESDEERRENKEWSALGGKKA